MEDDRSNMRIGPEGASPRDPASDHSSNDHTDAWDDPDDLLDQARMRIRLEDEQNKEGAKLMRRLIVAFVLVLTVGVVFYVVLPQYGLRLPPVVPALSFVCIVIGAVLTMSGNDDAGS